MLPDAAAEPRLGAEETVTLVLSPMGGITVAALAESVTQIVDWPQARASGVPGLDLAVHFDVALGLDPLARRFGFMVRAGTLQAVLAVGATIQFWQVGHSSLLGFPPLVEEHLSALGVDTLACLERGFAYLIDSHWLAQQASVAPDDAVQAPCRGGQAASEPAPAPTV